MRKYFKPACFFAAALILRTGALSAHEVVVHQAITSNAVAALLTSSVGFNSFLNTISNDLSSPSDASKFIIIGSAREDDIAKMDPIGGNRPYNHFYDPITGLGLSDFPPDLRVTLGTNSFAWGSISNSPGYNYRGVPELGRNVNTTNVWSWQNARGYEWAGLAATNKSDRFIAFTNMYRAVGQVVHLLQDASQPQHVRNEQHLSGSIWQSPIETFGELNWPLLNYQQSMLDWQGVGFSKLEDFWNTHSYNGNSTALDADAAGDSQLGMAEWCNGNFLGVRHKYAQFYNSSSIKYYPFPSLANTTQPQINPHNLSGTVIDSVTLENHKTGNRVYISKTGAGANITHHRALLYLAVAHTPKINTPGMAVSLTIRDANVLYDYHSAFIPRAVKYSAGLIDYFFRGTMYIQPIGTNTDDPPQITNLVLNTSGQCFTNGCFHLFYDDTNSTRTEISFSSTYSGTLAPNAAITNVFTAVSNVTQYLLVYQGSIGTTDPVDTNIAIAATTFHLETVALTNEYDYYVYDDFLPTLPATISTNLASDDFPFTPVVGNYEAFINGGQFDDAGTIGGISTTISGSSCGYPATFATAPIMIPAAAISVVGNHLEVTLTCTDNCRDMVGWEGLSIIWRAWPAP